MKKILKYWELIPTYGLPIFLLVMAMLSDNVWSSLAYVALSGYSILLTYVWLLIAAIRWDSIIMLLWFVPAVLLSLFTIMVTL